MTRWLGLALICGVAASLPAFAGDDGATCCQAARAASDGQTAGQANPEQRVQRLRWELYELDNNELATPRDRALKRAEYEAARQQLGVIRVAREHWARPFAQVAAKTLTTGLASVKSMRVNAPPNP